MNRYHIVEFVDAGGMGTVYKAWDDRMNVFLAMKVLNIDPVEFPAALRRFKSEGEKLHQLKHPNIIAYYGLFEDRGIHFLLEGLVNGRTLKEILIQRPGRRLPFSEALIYLRALCSSLGYAHAMEVVHCDVKPGNLMVDEAGNIYLTDFGIARSAGSLATTFAGMGTSSYMAPEQIQAGIPTAATDIYALGVMLFEMLTGQRPFTGDEPEVAGVGQDPGDRVRAAHLTLAPPDPRSLNPDISPQVSAAILKALRKNPAERFATTNEFLLAVSPFDPAKIPTRAPRPGLEPGGPLPSVHPFTRPQQKRKFPLPALFLALAGASVVVLLLLWKGSAIFANRNQQPTPAPTAALTAPPSVASSLPAGNPLPVVTVGPSDTPLPHPADTAAPATPAASNDSAVPPAGADQWTSPKDGMVLMRIPAGAFQMGSNASPWSFEAPEHTVTLDEFWIDQVPVTNAMFQKFVEATGLTTQAEAAGWGYVSPGKGEIKTNGADWRHPTGPDSSIEGKENDPVVLVTWNEASQYCAWVGRRLPTEAEWEKAARGEDGRLYPWGNAVDCSHANYSNVPDTSFCTGGVTAVDQYPQGASPYGVLDMAGNTWDWVADWYQSDYYASSPSTNPTGPATGDRRVHRGGAWYNFDLQVQTTYRFSNPPDSAFGSVGFRCGYSR